VLGECFQRMCWSTNEFLCIEECSDTWHERQGDSAQDSVFVKDYRPAIEDVMATDWNYCGPLLGGGGE
jgi:hypothetical protein